ncbi:hypothetical protein IQ06DRAFT_231299 [Phaeosphaeriaceae sp. SRC1lsM3a]|nr:hypothetical protein IQ06DRAFT_231299 [Stagonospora sp. SRC1lsM3a]
MHISNHIKAVFLLVNHLVAAHVPPVLISPPHRVRGATDLKARNVWQRNAPSNHDSNVSIEPLDLFPRQDKKGGSCDRRAKCKKKKIRNPTDETKCIRCPPTTKPDPTRSLCIKDKDLKKEDKKKELKERLMEKVKEKIQRFKELSKEKKKERLQKKKPEKSKDWERKDKIRKDDLNKKKNSRMGQCLPLVAVAIGTVAMLELADGGFTEDLLESIDMDMLELWPKDDINDDWFEKSVPGDLGDVSKEDFVKAYIEHGDSQNSNYSIGMPEHSVETREVSSVSAQHEEKRLVQGAGAIAGVAKAVSKAVPKGGGTTGAAGASKPSTFFSNKTPSLKRPGESKFSKADQKGKAKELAKNKNWKNCLKGEKPQK